MTVNRSVQFNMTVHLPSVSTIQSIRCIIGHNFTNPASCINVIVGIYHSHELSWLQQSWCGMCF